MRLSVMALGWYLALVVLMRPRLGPKPDLSNVSPTPPQVALAFLASTDGLYSGTVGFAGLPATQALAWKTILQLPRADTLFETLLKTGSRPAQLYALAGLYLTDTLAFRYQARKLANAQDSVLTVEGCIGMVRPVRDLVAELRTGRWSAALQTFHTVSWMGRRASRHLTTA